VSAGELDTTLVPFEAGDGRPLDLLHVTGRHAPVRGPVLLVHGAGVRADIFRPPLRTTLVDTLVEQGWDVWLENWRASIDLVPCRWTLDQAAVYDHPRAVRKVLEQTGADTLQAVVHCQGSTSFSMAAVAGLLPEVTTVVSNAVSLHPVIPRFSRFKINVMAPLVARLTPYMNPAWGLAAPHALARAMVLFVRLAHHECHNTVCRMVSFTYGTGFPALWSHENLSGETHEWLKREFAAVPFTFFSQMARCVERGHLVSVDGLPGLPDSFVAQAPKTDARFVFLAGTDNRCFLAESQQRTFRFFDGLQPNRHALHLFPGYGHLDVFLGRRAARDVFPTIMEELQ
jgi:hypothetical protein